MVQPIQYLPASATTIDPFGSLVEGLRLGASLEEMQAARADRELKMQQQQLAMQRQQQIADEYKRFNSLTERTPDDIARLAQFIPAEQTKNLLDIYKTRSTEQQDRLKLETGQLLSSLTRDPAFAVEDLKRKAVAYRDSGKIAEADQFDAYAKAAEMNPKAVYADVLTRSAGVFGKDWTESILKATGDSTGGQYLSRDEDKIKAGLVTSEGKPLAGTFFVQSGKKPELITQEPPKADVGYKILTPAEASARGLPTQGYTWQVNEKTGQIADLVKPPSAPVQVNLPGQPTPPTKLQEEMDKKFAPLAVEWMGGERSLANSRIRQLTKVVEVLGKRGDISGPVLGITPDVVKSFVAPASRSVRAKAEQVIQEGMRAVLGAQYTQKEGENLLARAYDPAAREADNAQRLGAIVEQMKETARDRDEMLKYMQGPGNGSLVGYTGRTPTMNDFIQGAEERMSGAAPAKPTVSNIRSQADAILGGGR
jgi:hypothetical protein